MGRGRVYTKREQKQNANLAMTLFSIPFIILGWIGYGMIKIAFIVISAPFKLLFKRK